MRSWGLTMSHRDSANTQLGVKWVEEGFHGRQASQPRLGLHRTQQRGDPAPTAQTFQERMLSIPYLRLLPLQTSDC